jgi:antitoxin VapB
MRYIYVATESAMTKAKLFITGGSQAVRLPGEFRFEGNEVDIRRDSTTGDIVLSKPSAYWEEYFDWVRRLELPRDFLEERNQPEDNLRDPLPRRTRG